jgi:tyrosyl-tRNA synthetase
MTFIEELQWRGLLFDKMPGIDEHLAAEVVTGYIGFDPTAPSLGIGNLVPIMLLVHLQRHGHKPIALVGGSTGMIGDPSGKSAERNLLDLTQLRYNENKVKEQLSKFLDFSSEKNAAVLVNNYDWMKDYTFLDFLRDVGKHLTVNYMIAKDSVKSRMETGISFTEFSYQLLQGYDFYWLYQNMGCTLQLGGSDQWGNMTAGTELVRRMADGEAWCITCPLITKADGTKFGKSEGGNVWLDRTMTSPYKFYQFWLNVTDEDAVRFIKIYTLLSKEEIEGLVEQEKAEPGKRVVQKRLAQEVTTMVHSEKDFQQALDASGLLFGSGTTEQLKEMDEELLLSVLDGVPQVEVSLSELLDKDIVDVLSTNTQNIIFTSKGEARKMIQGNGVSINKTKINLETRLDQTHILNQKYILAQKGKKDYFLLKIV